MSTHLHNERCPRCAAMGKDRHGDNLGIYSDGGVHCWSCGYTNNGSPIQKLKEKTQLRDGKTVKTYHLPGDISTEIPGEVRQWLQQFSLTDTDISNHNLLWSEHEQRLVFPIFGDNDELLAWQGRYLGKEDKPKWLTRGNIKNLLHLVGIGKREVLVIVEDLISAIRVGSNKIYSLPLFGSHISLDRWQRIRLLGFQTIICWLDKDKQIDSIKFAKQGREIGMSVRSVITDKDPKEYSNQDIKSILTQAMIA